MLDNTSQETTDARTSVAGQELRQFIERVERLEAEKKDISDAIKEIFAEAKARGLMVMAIRAIIKERAQDPDARAEFEAHMKMYRSAIGM